MVNRLILNLMHGVNAREDSEFRVSTGLEPPTFADGPFLGSIGGPLRILPDDFDDEVLEDTKEMDSGGMASGDNSVGSLKCELGSKYI